MKYENIYIYILFFFFLVRTIIKAKAKRSKRTFRGWEDVWLWIFFPSVSSLKLLTQNPILNTVGKLEWKL